ncbi:hypothetical protein AVEN_38588-1 [Araneus ventricosus]|uniref:Uncharacterized protein n=1 Tax=Araneus ventricosus TaxID=182803 RepID=A0A4Y2UD11_ARAVE|nr:hypothetical protein AVEN_38588-1 [Araneus ventricosus]
MYELFLNFYAAITGDVIISIAQNICEKYFNQYANFSFSLPRSNVCDVCFESILRWRDSRCHSTQTESKETQRDETRDFNIRVVSHFVVRLRTELALSKFPVTDQFHKRHLWLYLFNAHVPDASTPISYMFHLMKGVEKSYQQCVLLPVSCDKNELR